MYDHDSVTNESTSNRGLKKVIICVCVFLALLFAIFFICKKCESKKQLEVSVPSEITQQSKFSASNMVHFAFHLVYQDGTAVSNRTIQLHSDIRQETTDQNGYAVFDCVEQGEHSLYLLDKNGAVAAQKKIKITKSSITRVGSVTDSSSTMSISLSNNTRLIEISIVLNKNESNLSYLEDSLTYVTTSGDVVTGHGSATTNGFTVVTPGRHICLTDSVVILPLVIEGKRYIISADNILQQVCTGHYSLYSVESDGTIELKDGYRISPDGSVSNSTGVIDDKGKGIILSSDSYSIIGQKDEKPKDPEPINPKPVDPDKDDEEKVIPVETYAQLIALGGVKSDGTDTSMSADQRSFKIKDMLPGDSCTKYYCVKTSCENPGYLRFFALSQNGQKLHEVLQCKVTLWAADETGKYTKSILLFDGLLENMEDFVCALPKTSFYALTKQEENVFYEISVSLDTSVTEEYMGLSYETSFYWDLLQ